MDLPTTAHIVHIPGDVRREKNVVRLTASLHAAGIQDVHVFHGVQPQDSGPLYSSGEWGCYQSHLACLCQIARATDSRPVLVLEDDAVLSGPPEHLNRALAASSDWDFLHLGYLSNTVFRAWDDELLEQPVLRVRGVLYGTQCYAARPARMASVVAALERLPFEQPEDGGGVGIDGALCEVTWRDPTLVRLAPPRPLFHTLPGVRSSLRSTSVLRRGAETARALARPVRRLASSPA